MSVTEGLHSTNQICVWLSQQLGATVCMCRPTLPPKRRPRLPLALLGAELRAGPPGARCTSEPRDGGAAMGVCQFFLRGYCRFGDRCWNEHPRGGAGRPGAAPAHGTHGTHGTHTAPGRAARAGRTRGCPAGAAAPEQSGPGASRPGLAGQPLLRHSQG